tara:strand:- start:230 stop:925 length:696 start_codon:yes stop_codon:yes gene_type:complete
MATTKKPVIGPATRAKVTGVVRKVQNSKAAGAVKKASAAIKQEARVVGRAVTGYAAKKEKAKASSSPASAFQIKSEVFGNGKIKSPDQIRAQKKQDRSESRVANRMSRSADRSKRGADRSFTTSYPSSGSSERFQSSKGGLTMYKDGAAISLPKARRKAIRVISENLNTKAEGRDRKKLAKEQYKQIKSKPKTDAQMRKQNAKKCKGKQAATTGGGNNLCSPQGNNNAGGF